MKTYMYLFSIMMLVISNLSCKKFVTVDIPGNLISDINTFSQDETAISALTGIYSRMGAESNMPYNLTLYCSLSADELRSFSTSTSLALAYSNNLNSVTATNPDFWTIWYNHIYQANAVIEGCTASGTLSAPVKKQLIAEARFIRAFWYFYLTNLYGNVPLIISTDYAKNSVAANSTQDELYSQMITDLVYAEENLNPSYVGLNSVSSVPDRIRPNSFAASALLARVYLFNKNWTLAEKSASRVIGNTAYDIVPLASTFLRTSQEAIWQIGTSTPYSLTANTFEGLYFILTAKPLTGLLNCTSINSSLYGTFQPGDQRKSSWIGKFTDVSVTPNVDYFFPNKFKVKTNLTTSTEYTMPLRLAEQYLIRAEARVRQGNTGQGKDDLDKIRRRAGLGDIPISDSESLLLAILAERRVEFFVEYGHRWLDLKRTGTVDKVMNTYAPLKGGTWKSYKALWPIPQKEITNDVNLKQNPEYN